MSYKQYPKRDAIKNYFPLPNEIFCLGLCSDEIAVYAYLMFCEDRKIFQCHPSYKTIGRALKMSRNTVSKYVKSLEAKRLIRTEPTSVITKKGQKRNGSLLYTVRPIQEAIECNCEQQMRHLQAGEDRQKALEKLEKYEQKLFAQ